MSESESQFSEHMSENFNDDGSIDDDDDLDGINSEERNISDPSDNSDQQSIISMSEAPSISAKNGKITPDHCSVEYQLYNHKDSDNSIPKPSSARQERLLELIVNVIKTKGNATGCTLETICHLVNDYTSTRSRNIRRIIHGAVQEGVRRKLLINVAENLYAVANYEESIPFRSKKKCTGIDKVTKNVHENISSSTTVYTSGNRGSSLVIKKAGRKKKEEELECKSASENRGTCSLPCGQYLNILESVKCIGKLPRQKKKKKRRVPSRARQINSATSSDSDCHKKNKENEKTRTETMKESIKCCATRAYKRMGKVPSKIGPMSGGCCQTASDDTGQSICKQIYGNTADSVEKALKKSLKKSKLKAMEERRDRRLHSRSGSENTTQEIPENQMDMDVGRIVASKTKRMLCRKRREREQSVDRKSTASSDQQDSCCMFKSQTPQRKNRKRRKKRKLAKAGLQDKICTFTKQTKNNARRMAKSIKRNNKKIFCLW